MYLNTWAQVAKSGEIEPDKFELRKVKIVKIEY